MPTSLPDFNPRQVEDVAFDVDTRDSKLERHFFMFNTESRVGKASPFFGHMVITKTIFLLFVVGWT
jgi:hypothetical protein